MNIAGVLIHTRPGAMAAVRVRLEEIPGTVVHAETDDGRLIVTVEHDEDSVVADTVLGLHRLEGVLSAAMVYQQSEDPGPDNGLESSPENAQQNGEERSP